jgi:carbonic anhydrase
MMTGDDDELPKPVWLQQSPIDVVDSLFASGLRPLEFCYPELVHGRVEPRSEPGFSFLLNEPHTAVLHFDGQRCPLSKIHVHSRSEHRIASQDFPLEIHMVHKIPDPRWGSTNVVVGVFVDVLPGPADEVAEEHPFTHIARSLQSGGLDALDRLNPNHCLPRSRDFYRYEGSLTTPRYDESVSWILLREPLKVLTQDIRELMQWAGHHARPPQPSNRRFVLRSFR